MKQINKIRLLFILLYGLIVGPLFGAAKLPFKAPKIETKELKNVIEMQGFYNELSELVPAVVLLQPEKTTGVSEKMIENLYSEIKLQMVLNAYFKPVSMTKYLDGKYGNKKENNIFQFMDGIKNERYQVNLKGVFKSKIFKCGSEYIVYMAVVPLNNQGYPITSLRIIKNEKELQEAVIRCLSDLNKLMQEYPKGNVRLAIHPFEISCRTLVEQKTGEFDFIKTSFSNQEGIELKEADDIFSSVLAHQATATGLYSAVPLNLIPEYVNDSVTSTAISSRADYLVKTKIILSNKKNIITMSLIKTDSGTLVKKFTYFTESLNTEEMWKFTNLFLAEITDSIYAKKNYKLLNDIASPKKGFYKDGMFIGWDVLNNFPVPSGKLIINTGTKMVSDVAMNPNNFYSRENNDFFIYGNNDEVKIFKGREGAYVWNLLEK